MNFTKKRSELITALEDKGLNVEGRHSGRKTEILFSLTGLGISGVYATISIDEIEYQAENE